LEAKSKVGHRRWIAWLEANVTFTPRAAQGYMRVAREWGRLEAKAKHVSHLTYREALAVLAEPREGDGAEDDADESAGHKRPEELPAEARHDLAAKWWDILASYKLAQDARGWDG
jgi:hypothetical protein